MFRPLLAIAFAACLAPAAGLVPTTAYAAPAAGRAGSAVSMSTVSAAETTPGPPPAGFRLATPAGEVMNFGAANSYGSMAGVALTKPVVGIAATPDGKGYWLVASDGGIFTFGDAAFYGSTGSLRLNQPIVAMAPTPDSKGYWLVASDGGIFTFGDAVFYGSTGANPPADGAEKLVAASTGGYWIIDQNGAVHPFGNAGINAPTQSLMFHGVTQGDRAVTFAFTQINKPYIWGGTGPVGYDCSGLTYRSWQVGAGVILPRVANAQYQGAGVAVGWNDLQAGDLLFWGSNTADWTSVYHAAMYVGGGQIVESTGDHVQLNSVGQWGSSDLMPHGMRP